MSSYPVTKDKVRVPEGTPDGTLFVSVDGTWKVKGNPYSLEDCARGYWTEKNLKSSHGYDCDWLMARKRGRIVGVWKINRKKGWMVPSATPKKSWPDDKPTDQPRNGCELIVVDEETAEKFIGQEVHLGRSHNSLRGYFHKNQNMIKKAGE